MNCCLQINPQKSSLIHVVSTTCIAIIPKSIYATVTAPFHKNPTTCKILLITGNDKWHKTLSLPPQTWQVHAVRVARSSGGDWTVCQLLFAWSVDQFGKHDGSVDSLQRLVVHAVAAQHSDDVQWLRTLADDVLNMIGHHQHFGLYPAVASMRNNRDVIRPDVRHAGLKALLRRNNRWMRRGRTDEADTLATRVRKAITLHCMKWLRNINTRQDPKEAWAKVREFTRATGTRSGHQPDS